jgi:hypothetical protein
MVRRRRDRRALVTTYAVHHDRVHALSHGLATAMCGTAIPADVRRLPTRPTDVDPCPACVVVERRINVAAQRGRPPLAMVPQLPGDQRAGTADEADRGGGGVMARAPRANTAIRFPLAIHARLVRESEERDLSINWLVNRAVEDFLNRLTPVSEWRLTRDPGKVEDDARP